MSVRLRRLAADVRDYIALLPDETPAVTRRRLVNWADELEEAGGYADDTAVLPFVIHQMDSWLALDAPYPDRRLVIEWIGRLQDLEREHEAASVPLAADWTPTSENINKLPFPIREYIHQVQTRADPAGETQELVLARQTIRALDIRLAECEAECRRLRGDSS